MNPFREITPFRRLERAECEHYGSYKDTLREDFNKRCGYCDNSDRFRIRSFTIDHFVPKNPKIFTHKIKPNYYYNLVYACWFCNSAKSNKWFTNNANLHNDGKVGFIEPTSEEYTSLFKRDKNGMVICNGVNSVLAEHIIIELNLWLPVHRIVWRLEKLFNLEEIISAKLQESPNDIWKTELEIIRKEITILTRDLFAVNE